MKVIEIRECETSGMEWDADKSVVYLYSEEYTVFHDQLDYFRIFVRQHFVCQTGSQVAE